MSFLLFMLQLLLALMRVAVSVHISLPNCADRCGEVQIPYPFGIGHNCYYNKSYEITCNYTFIPPKPFLRRFNVEVWEIKWPRGYINLGSSYPISDTDMTLTVGLQSPSLCRSGGTKKEVRSLDLQNSPFQFSIESNVFMVEGCGGSVVLKYRNGSILTGCTSLCGSDSDSDKSSTGNRCYGVGCCQASLLPFYTSYYFHNSLDYYEISLDVEELGAVSNSCNITGIFTAEDLSVKDDLWPTILEWQVDEPSVNNDKLDCFWHSGSEAALGCHCKFPYEGYAYLPNGCQVMEECRKCKFHQHCGIQYNETGTGHHFVCERNPLLKRASSIGFSSGMVFVLLVLGGYWLYRYLKRRREIKQKADNFKRNGGYLLLQQQMYSSEGIVEKTKVYTVSELEKATNNFNENRILGQGGQGMVYKGMLMDGRIVAIKKSKKVDETQVEPFINEVVILSQINHRNVVGLLGCCLETDVPILVYEFIPNGTLYEHIQGADDAFHITWKMRLQIAAESADAIAYLHSSSAAPIYHRDIKSTNILLDKKYRAKVSDFGTSRSITIEQTHVTTAVQGTYGYLDPEYFQSNQFTAKSDVYSFGVVLVELLTGKKPICPVGNGSWLSLAVEFLSKMEDSRLSEILDSRILDEGKESEFIAVAKLARKCLNMNGKLRPTMKEISVRLDAIRSSQMMSISEEAKTKENILHDDPSSRSIEIQPLMSRK